MTRTTKITYAKIAVILAAMPVLVYAHYYGPDSGFTNAPGDNATACISSGCHIGTVNSGPGNVKINLPSGNTGTYVPGQAMQILVQITDSTKVSYGFQLTARMGAGNTTQAGDFSNTDSNASTSLTQVLCADDTLKANGSVCKASFSVQDIEHTDKGYTASTKASPKGAYTYSFNWTPPATGTVTMYVAANSGPGTMSTTPTNVYTSSIKLTPATSSPPTPSINAGGIGPIYSAATTIQPGSWISIYGTNLVSTQAVWDGTFPIPTTLGGATVTINGKPAYLWVAVPKAFGTTDQINAQAPDDAATGTVNVTVTNATNGAATSSVTLATVGPSFSVLGDAARHAAAVILTPNGTGAYGGGTYDIDGPAGTSLGYPTRPVKAGETIVLFGVGFGPTNPVVPAGKAYSGPASGAPITSSLQLTIGGVSIPAPGSLQFAGLTGVGLYQFNIVVPAGLGTGDKALQAIVAGVQTPTGVVVAVQ